MVLLTIIGNNAADARTPFGWAALAHYRSACCDFLLELGALDDIRNQGVEGLLHIYSVFCGGLQVYQIEAGRHFFGLIQGNHSLIISQVVFIAQKDNFYVCIVNLSDLTKPVGYVFKT